MIIPDEMRSKERGRSKRDLNSENQTFGMI